jgi:metal-sulfur cluster biosynthetic enzyme
MSDETAGASALRERVLEALSEVIDPELGLDVVALGLVYGVDVDAGRVQVRVTMTTPACPLGEQIVRDAQERIAACEGVAEAHVELVWEPPWSPSRMSPSAKEALGWST